MARLFKNTQAATTHEEIFAERYSRLRAWALQLAEQDKEVAEDLLHDTFVQFTLTMPCLDTILNLDGYLYGMMRNLRLSQVRRDTRQRLTQLSVIEYDSAADGLHTVDLRDHIQAQDLLRNLCRHICVRKESSRAASVLILRFFLGYFPGEIAKLLRTSRAAIDVRLLKARSEAKAYLEDPRAWPAQDESSAVSTFPVAFARTTDDFLNELRATVFQSRRGDCMSRKQWHKLYAAPTPRGPIEVGTLAHLVSCPRCLDEVNTMLDLPPLSERNAAESSGRDKRSGGGSGSGPTDGGRSGSPLTSLRRRARRAFEHKPRALCVAVNGYVQGSQQVNSELSELSLHVSLAEPVGFIEIFSEQNVRLLLLNIDELPPQGPGEHSARAALSDGRSLEVNLKFCVPRPTVRVVYHDPTHKEIEALLSTLCRDEIAPPLPSRPEVVGSQQSEPIRDAGSRSRQVVSGSLRKLSAGFAGLMTPRALARVTGGLLLATLVVALLTPWRTVPAVSADELIERVTSAHEARLQTVGEPVMYQKLQLKRAAPASQGAEAIKWEVWSDVKNSRVRQSVDDGSGRRFISLDDGGASSKKRHPAEAPAPEIIVEFARVLQANGMDSYRPLSVASYQAWRASLQNKHEEVKESPLAGGRKAFTLYTVPAEPAAIGQIVEAAFVVQAEGWRPVEQRLKVRTQDGERVYEFTELESKVVRLSELNSTIFAEPPSGASPVAAPAPLPSVGPRPGEPPPIPAPVVPTAELKIEVLRLLSQAGADLGEQVDAAITPDGTLRVTGVVESEQRKSEILAALGPVAGHPAVRIEIQTVEEAVARQRQSNAAPAQQEAVQGVEIQAGAIAAEAVLRAHFAGEGAQAGEAARKFASRSVGKSRQAMQHLWAMKRLLNQFSLAELRGLTPEARGKHLSIFRAHAQAYEQQMAALRRELKPIFFPDMGEGRSAAAALIDYSELVKVIEQLFEQGSDIDSVVRSAFTTSTGSASVTAIQTPQFWRSMLEAESLAERIQSIK